MRRFLVLGVLGGALLSGAAWALDPGGQPTVVTPILSTKVTSAGQPIALPQGEIEVTASMFEIAPGATLPVHEHPFPRYGYMLEGTLKVTNVENGQSHVFEAGDFIVEMVGLWHQGANIGSVPVKLLVIDQVPVGQAATILRQ